MLIAVVPRLRRLAATRIRPHLVSTWANIKTIADPHPCGARPAATWRAYLISAPAEVTGGSGHDSED